MPTMRTALWTWLIIAIMVTSVAAVLKNMLAAFTGGSLICAIASLMDQMERNKNGRT